LKLFYNFLSIIHDLDLITQFYQPFLNMEKENIIKTLESKFDSIQAKLN
jgi:hypothetical protein